MTRAGHVVREVPGRTEARPLLKGNHIVVRRLYEHDRAYLFQTPDRRVTGGRGGPLGLELRAVSRTAGAEAPCA